MEKANYALVTALAAAAAIGGLLFGYDTAVISGAVDAESWPPCAVRKSSQAVLVALIGLVEWKFQRLS